MFGKHKVKAIGKLIIQRVSNIGSISFTSERDKARLVYDNNSQNLYFGSGQTSTFRTLFDIPLGTRVLFESNTAILGYSLFTDLNDRLVYITSGSGAGGEVGGSAKSGGTWSQPGHYHGMNSHTHTSSHYHTISHAHTMAQHNHRWFDYVSNGAGYTWDSSGIGLRNYGIGGYNAHGLCINSQNDGDGHLDTAKGDFWTAMATISVDTNNSNTSTDAPATYGPSTNATSTYTPSSSWRPAGITYTRQQRI
jgi:hypothetical protein